jgi:hypothetical protein
MVPGAGIEPARLAAGDFESPASTNFTTRAARLKANYDIFFEANCSSLRLIIQSMKHSDFVAGGGGQHFRQCRLNQQVARVFGMCVICGVVDAKEVQCSELLLEVLQLRAGHA